MINTKQQILSRYIDRHQSLSNRDALEAMDVYANELATKFAEWLVYEPWVVVSEGVWRSKYDMALGTKTTQELLEIFKQSQL